MYTEISTYIDVSVNIKFPFFYLMLEVIQINKF